MPLEVEICPEEIAKQSTHSPALVGDQERLGRFVYADDHVEDDTGDLKTGAFKMSDLIEAERKGFSVTRIAHTTAQELLERGAKFERGGEGRRFRGLGVGLAQEVRSICDRDGKRALCVVDDGLCDHRAHTLIMRSALYRDPEFSDRQLRSKLKRIRESLVNLFSPVMSVEEILG